MDKKLKRWLLFLEQYHFEYPEDELKYIQSHFDKNPQGEICDLLLQIYATLDMLEKDKNPYLGLLQVLQKHHHLNQDILEIGGGYYPTFAQYIDKVQALKGGSITTYDPKLITTKLGNIHLHKKLFNLDHPTQHYHLIVGVLPCEASELTIKASLQQDSELFLVLCNCWHQQGYRHIHPDTFHQYLKTLLQENSKGFTIYQEKLNDGYHYPYEIIGRTKK